MKFLNILLELSVTVIITVTPVHSAAVALNISHVSIECSEQPAEVLSSVTAIFINEGKLRHTLVKLSQTSKLRCMMLQSRS